MDAKENETESTQTPKTTKEDEDTDIGEEQTMMMTLSSESDDFEKKQTTEASFSDRSSSSHDSTTEDSKPDLRGGGGGGSEGVGGGGGGSCRSCSTPLRLRRLPASFWQEPNVPKDRGKKRPVPCKVCHGPLRSCHPPPPPPPNHLFYPTKEDHRAMQFGSYGDGDFLGGRYRDPAGASPALLLPGLTTTAASSPPQSGSGGGTFYPATDLFCRLDHPPTPSSPAGSCLGAHGFLPLPSSIRLGPVGPPTELPVAAAGAGTPCSSFFATAALYGHVMRRSLHSSSSGSSSYRHGNGGYGDVMAATSSGSLDDLWRLFPCRPLPEVFGSKRFHPYL